MMSNRVGKWILAGLVSGALSACSSTPKQEKSAGLDPETQALIAIFANPEGTAPRPAAEATPVQTPHQDDKARKSSAYDAWYGKPDGAPPPSQPSAPGSRQPVQATAPSADESNPVGTLPPQRLAGGTCGMFLWVRQAQANLVFFGHGADGAARMKIRDQVVDLERIGVDGTSLFGQFANQLFQAGDLQVELNVNFDRRADLVHGTKIPQGRLKVMDRSGWSYVMPVAGLIACQAADP